MNIRNLLWRNFFLALVVAMLSACAETPEDMLASAKEYLAKGDPKAAVIQLKSALQKNPALAEARFLLGTALLDTGEFPASEKELRKALELEYPADQVVPTLVRALVAGGQYKNAIDEFGTASISSPQATAELQSALGQAYIATGNTAAGKAAFEMALAAKPDYPPAILGVAGRKAAAGDLPGALAAIDAALAKTPTFAEGWYFKGSVLDAQQQREGALAAYRNAIAAKPDMVAAHSAIVTLLFADGKMEEVAAQIEAMKKVAPKNAQTLYLQAVLAFRDKNYVAAREAIQQHLTRTPNNLPGLILGAQIDYQLGSYAQVEVALLTVLKRAPNQMYARRLLVQSYLRAGNPSKALDALKPALLQASVDSDTLAIAGEVYAQNGDMDSAARYFNEASARDPLNKSKRATVALFHFAKGEIGAGELEVAAAEDTGIRVDLALLAVSVRQRKFDQALDTISAIEKKQPDKPLPHNLRGEVLLAKGDSPGARNSFERAFAVDPLNFRAIANLAKLDVAEKRPQDATKRLEAALAKDPKNVELLLAMANLRARTGGSKDEVVALIGKAIAANPVEPLPRLALMDLYLRSKELNQAVAAARDAVAAIPDRAEILDAAGQVHSAAGEVSQAIATYNSLAKLHPDSPLAYLRIAAIHNTAQNRADAIENLRKALAIKPDLLEARRALAALDVSTEGVKAALASAREMQKQNPGQAYGYLLEGDIYARQGAWSEAVAAYKNGLKTAGTTDLAIRLAAALRAGKGGDVEAEKFIASWVKDHPRDSVFRRYVAELASRKKDYARAAQQYKAILEYAPNDAAALNNLANAGSHLNDPMALEYAERANKLAPNNAAILDTLGMLLVAKGDTKRGVEAMQQAAGLAPNSPILRLNLARALVADGQKAAAKKELDTLAKLGDKFPDQREVAALMQRL